MTDVVAVALISAGSSLLGASVGALTTYKVSLRNSETTIATAEAQKGVELARIKAENTRLREQHRESERQNRQSTYHQFIEAATRVYQTMGENIPTDEIGEICTSYGHFLAGVVLFGPTSVREGTYQLHETYQKIWPALDQKQEENPDMSYSEHWRDASKPLKGDFGEGISEVLHLMHADVTRGIVEDEPTKAGRP